MGASLMFWIEAGGPIVVLLAVLSVISLALIAAKSVQLVPAARGARGRAAALRAWVSGAKEEAVALLSAGRTPCDRVGLIAMRGLLEARSERLLQAELESAGGAELDALSSHVRLLELIAMVSPLLGLLGTVLGMIDSFRALEAAQGSANAAVLAGGVWTALLTTAMGLIVAIPAAVAAGLFSARVDRVAREIERTVASLVVADRERVA